MDLLISALAGSERCTQVLRTGGGEHLSVYAWFASTRYLSKPEVYVNPCLLADQGSQLHMVLAWLHAWLILPVHTAVSLCRQIVARFAK